MGLTWIYFSLDSYPVEAWNNLAPSYYKEGTKPRDRMRHHQSHSDLEELSKDRPRHCDLDSCGRKFNFLNLLELTALNNMYNIHIVITLLYYIHCPFSWLLTLPSPRLYIGRYRES